MGFGSYKTAWSWLHKIRASLMRSDAEPLEQGVEIDEAYVGSKRLGKALVLVAIARVLGGTRRVGIATGMTLSQVGEFSFVLATISQSGAEGPALMSPITFRAMVSATIVTLLFTPYFVAAAPWAGARCERIIRMRDGLVEEEQPVKLQEH